MAEPVRDGPGHLLSLKVMRVSRPALASAWQPFYSSSPSFSSHSTESILSLQGKTPLSGHPKTLRDLHLSELLTLPSSFGSIQLGETFSSCLCVNNEAQVAIDAVSMKVEMQTVTAKIMLAEFGGTDTNLAIGDTLENVVHHEIKELGQHVLACTVTYRLPPGSRAAPGPAEDPNDPSLQTFRKFYKFAVTNPLSVKTKVHAARSPSALLSSTERDKVFLEVHIQNLTAETMWFERMRFECTDEWDVVDGNVIDVDREEEPESIFSGSTALMQPQDMRQYIYILSRKSTTLAPAVYAPGTIVPLGRLDISWRSSYGEPGRLLTSMLSRRIPLVSAPAQQPVSALPPYLKRNATSSTGGPPRPRSPQLPQSRPGSPTALQRPGSPFRNRPPSTVVGRPQTPPPQPAPLPAPDIDISLTVRDVPRDSIKLETPFKISLTLVVSASVSAGRRRSLLLAVQHLQPPRTALSTIFPPNPPPPEPYSPRFTSPGFSTPSPISATFNYALAHQKLLAVSPSRQGLDDGSNGIAWALPPPFFEGADELRVGRSGVIFCGPSAIFLQPVEFIRPADDEEKAEGEEDVKVQETQDFELSYMPTTKGFSTVGGLRVILLEDRSLEESSDPHEDKSAFHPEPKILKEWEVVAEVWVSST
ncbi:hypothetical protein DFH07DRAFT_742457 [Mycena maculata]|uniref:DUF974-domain-containing protein n=1 Tax=Mycena maculata TaxID=230809 RepID=A0AAD7J4W9_9AGAR|nr:hypothetical protein DFH07DRAFT_742457 [Mycena maculata]